MCTLPEDPTLTRPVTELAEYKAWANIIQRCTNPKHPNYPDYGGRGITICEEWRHSFATFFAAVGRRPSPQHSIERKKNNLGYQPGNVCWATGTEQARNRRRSSYATFRGETKHLKAWCEELGLPYVTIYFRLHRGWDAERAFTTPVSERRRAPATATA
jgi:hypothetical protein